MAFNSRITDDKSYICKVSTFQQLKHVFVQAGLRHLNSNVKHPDVVEAQFAVISSENIKLAFHNIRCMTTSGSGTVIARLNLFPMIRINVKDMYIVHPMNTIVATEVVNL